jgi:hypothetical protein
MTLPIEQPSVSTMDLCSTSTPTKDSINGNACPTYDYKINWGKK